MILAAGLKERIFFPPFHLDVVAGQVVCGNETVDLTPKAFSVLQYLAERPKQLISKEELLRNVWPDVHVSSNSLKVAVAQIRKALDDPSREPRFIETAHRRGYRFIAKTVEEPERASKRVTAEIPKTNYARSGDVNIAYQVIGEGALDLVFVMGWVSHLDYFWTEPSFARFLRRLGSFSRLILFDKRGTGLSDRVLLGRSPDARTAHGRRTRRHGRRGLETGRLCGVSRRRRDVGVVCRHVSGAHRGSGDGRHLRQAHPRRRVIPGVLPPKSIAHEFKSDAEEWGGP